MEENIIKIKENNINIKICQKNNFLRNLKALLSVSYLKLLSSFFAAKFYLDDKLRHVALQAHWLLTEWINRTDWESKWPQTLNVVQS